MSTNLSTQRLAIFNKYSKHLRMLIENGIIDLAVKRDSYLCPICTDLFTIEDLDQTKKNPLTLEDVPPVTLGGKANILTCKECNNKAGTKYDSHLVNAINSNSNSSLIPRNEFSVNVEKDGKKYTGIVRITDEGNLVITHNEKKNHPKNLKEYMDSISTGELVNVKLFLKDVDESKVAIALLKIAYLLIFQKYGYSFILRPNFDAVRKQLQYPDESHIKVKFVKEVPIKSQMVPFLTDREIECIYPTFPLKFNSFTQWFSVIISFTNRTPAEISDEIARRIIELGKYTIGGDTMEGDYLFNIQIINKMLDWMDQRC